MSSAATVSQPVDPARLAAGRWCHRANKTVGQGDIAASYSGDRIGMGKPLRKAFTWQGAPWVCVGIGHKDGGASAEAYRLVHPQVFDGDPVSYREKLTNSDAARADVNGFYHGMIVKHAGGDVVLCGPPVRFIPGKAEQLSLF